jgi:hypothetical protein
LNNANSQAQTNVTIDATVRRSIGGVGTLDRAKYFNHWGSFDPPTNTNLGNLAAQVRSEQHLNSFTGRETFEFDFFVAKDVPEDPNNPGFFRRSDLVNNL